jgi:hypothetical protein
VKNTQGQCWECDAVGEVNHHHVVPKSRGGKRTVPLCLACHAHAHHRKGSMSTPALTREALAVKKARGERTGGLPVGYRVAADGRTLEVDPVEAEILAAVRELRAAGLSLRAVTEGLARAGFTTRKGGAIGHTQVARILAREATT